MWRKGNPSALLVGMQTGAAILKKFGHSSKIKNGTALWPSNSDYGNITKETCNTSLKEDMWYMYPYVHCSIIYNSQDLEAAQVPISRWMDKEAVVHLHNTIQLQKPFVAAWIGLESIMLSEINQSEKN